MKDSIEPISKSKFLLARKLRVVFFLILTVGIGYLFYSYESRLGIVLTVLTAVLWCIEIVRGNHAEDAMLKEMNDENNPLK